MKQPQCIIIKQIHLVLSKQTRALRRTVFSGAVNCMFFHGKMPISHGFGLVFITCSSPDIQKPLQFFVSIDNCGGQQLNFFNNSRALPLLDG